MSTEEQAIKNERRRIRDVKRRQNMTEQERMMHNERRRNEYKVNQQIPRNDSEQVVPNVSDQEVTGEGTPVDCTYSGLHKAFFPSIPDLLFPCVNSHREHRRRKDGGGDGGRRRRNQPEVEDQSPLDETLGHSFCYVRSSAHFLSPDPSNRFVSPSGSLRFSPPHDESHRDGGGGNDLRGGGVRGGGEIGFRSISGASVSANTSISKTVLQLDADFYDNAIGSTSNDFGVVSINGGGFETSASFSALPLQPAPRINGGEMASGPIERGFFMSGPMERGALSGPLDGKGAGSDSGRVNYSAPLGLGGPYVKRKRRRRRTLSGFGKVFSANGTEKKMPWVVPVLNFVGRREIQTGDVGGGLEVKNEVDNDVQWALGKAGEDRVHVVVSEEHGWLFVGIYDGFNGPDAPEFLMGNLYRAVFNELEGLFWDVEENAPTDSKDNSIVDSHNLAVEVVDENELQDSETVKRVTFQEVEVETRSRKLFEFLADEDLEEGIDLSGSQRFAFSVDDALGVNNAGSAVSRRSLLLSKLKQGLSMNKEGRTKNSIPWKFSSNHKEKDVTEDRAVEPVPVVKRRKVGPVEYESVLRALSRALELTELGYLDMTDKFLDRNPELALMGSCLLAVLMRDEDVYVMNVGDSRAIVAQYEAVEASSSNESKERGGHGLIGDGIVEDSTAAAGEGENKEPEESHVQAMRLAALQLSTDHSTSIEEEVTRIKNEHPDDNQCFVNDRVKGRLKVTRAFGAGFLKQPKWNDVLLEMFRNDYIGTAPYISCTPSLRHHKLCPRDQFLILSSDGLYQYFSNQQAVSEVETFMEKFPDGDPAQHLIEELLFRAAKKAGMDVHELIDIPQGDRRKYHDDVTVMVVSLEGRIWKSSGKYL